jgi:hypothetical protein
LRFAAPLARFAREWLSGGRLAESWKGCGATFGEVRRAHLGAASPPS